jgi:sugar diacid utilization regulator
MMPLTYDALLTMNPFYLSTILAGWEGRKNPCQYVFLNESPLQKDSLLLVSDSKEYFSLIESSIKDLYTTGIIIFAKRNEYIPSSLIDLANQVKKPILLLTNQDGEFLYKKTNQILQLYKNDLTDFIKDDLTTYWLHLFYQESIQHVMEILSRFMGQTVYLFPNKKEIVTIGTRNPPAKNYNEFKKIDNFDHSMNKVTIIQKDELEYYSYTIVDPNGQIIGYLVFEKKYQLGNPQIELLKTIESTIIIWFQQKELAQSIHTKYKDQFLFDILHNNIDTESELIDLGRLRNIHFKPNGQVLAINISSNQILTKEIILDIQDLLITTNFLDIDIHSTYISHRIVSILFPTMTNKTINKDDLINWIRKFQDQISKKYSSVQTIVGLGRSYYSNLDIYKSFQEAKIALQMHDYVQNSKGVIHYSDIGYIRLLSYIHDELLNDFANEYIGQLEKQDRENVTELVPTLNTYCNHHGDISKTAESLYIHQNTLRQRLKKIESILGIQLNNYGDLVNLILSLKISQDMKK